MASDKLMVKVKVLRSHLRLLEDALVAKQNRIDVLEMKVTDLTRAGNNLASSAQAVIKENEELAQHRDACAELAKIFSMTAAKLMEFTVPVFVRPRKAPEQPDERES
jgi:hypothetical protein